MLNTHLCRAVYRINLPDECVSTKLRVAVNHVCFHLVTQFYYYYYYYYYYYFIFFLASCRLLSNCINCYACLTESFQKRNLNTRFNRNSFSLHCTKNFFSSREQRKASNLDYKYFADISFSYKAPQYVMTINKSSIFFRRQSA